MNRIVILAARAGLIMARSRLHTAAEWARRASGVAAVSIAISAGWLGAALCIEACGVDEASGRRVVLSTRLEAAAGADSFTTALGWNVTLSRALLSTGPFYYFDGAPPLVLRFERPRWATLRAALGLGEVFAHPGHYKAGEALGQMLQPWSVDLLAGGADLPVGDGVTGLYRSASFSFTAPAEGPIASELGGQAVIVEGTARREGTPPLRFLATADLGDIERSAANGYIDGCPFDELEIEGDGRVTVQVTPRVWFDLVDFSELEPAADGAVEFPPDSQPKIAFALGLAQLSAYKFSFSTP
jgi:hypothetical protein